MKPPLNQFNMSCNPGEFTHKSMQQVSLNAERNIYSTVSESHVKESVYAILKNSPKKSIIPKNSVPGFLSSAHFASIKQEVTRDSLQDIYTVKNLPVIQ